MFVLENIKLNQICFGSYQTKFDLESLWYSPLKLAKRLSSVTQIITPESELVCTMEIAELTVLLTF